MSLFDAVGDLFSDEFWVVGCYGFGCFLHVVDEVEDAFGGAGVVERVVEFEGVAFCYFGHGDESWFW